MGFASKALWQEMDLQDSALKNWTAESLKVKISTVWSWRVDVLKGSNFSQVYNRYFFFFFF